MNAGKTTVARILKDKIPRVAHVEKLRQFIEWMPIEESIPLNMKNITSLTRNFVQAGLNVIISYPVSSENFATVQRSLADLGQDIQVFTLAPSLDIVTTNRGQRELADWEVDVIRESYTDGLATPDFGVIIDNSHQTPDQTAQYILDTLSK